MVKLTKNNGEAVSFSVKGAGRLLVKILKEGINLIKTGIKWVFKKAHEGLTWLEDKALKKLDKLGKYAEKKILERTEPEPEEIIE